MIKNIVFDMGKVLIEFETLKVCYQCLKDEQDIQKIAEALFRAPEWIELDRGTITEEEAMTVVKGRLEDVRLQEAAQFCLEHWDEYNIWPKEGMEEVINDLKERGYRLYLLTNAPLRARRFLHIVPGMDLFDGILVSAEEKCIKPERAIYERLFEKFDLVPEECFFIDDVWENIEGARACGMEGFCFERGDVSELREFLDKM